MLKLVVYFEKTNELLLKFGRMYRMQVEVSKHTEGSKENMLRPNGLPESLIRYDGT